MEKIRQILDILRGNKQSVIFGLQHALGIFRQTKGRYDGDETKAVPFAILATAQALGAEIMIHQEGESALKEIEQAVEMNRRCKQMEEEKTKRTLASLLERAEKEKMTLAEFQRNAEEILKGLGDRQEEVQATMEFFTV